MISGIGSGPFFQPHHPHVMISEGLLSVLCYLKSLNTLYYSSCSHILLVRTVDNWGSVFGGNTVAVIFWNCCLLLFCVSCSFFYICTFVILCIFILAISSTASWSFWKGSLREDFNVLSLTLNQSAPWSWKVMEFRKTIFQAWKVMVHSAKSMVHSKGHGKVMENDGNVMEFFNCTEQFCKSDTNSITV